MILILAFPRQDEDFIGRLKEYSGSLKTVSADFKQQKFTALMDNPLESKGIFYFEAPDKIRWEQKNPGSTYFILNGNQVIQFDGIRKSTSDKMSIQMNLFREFLVSTIDGSLLDDPAFSKTIEKKSGLQKITLKPIDKRIQKRIQQIEMDFEEKSLQLQKLKLVENHDEYMVIDFSNQVINSKLPVNAFQ